MAVKNSARFGPLLDTLRDEIASSDLLPPPYTHYQVVLAESLKFFLSRMTRQRLERLVADQVALPFSASTAERVVTLLHHIPALHKLAQVLARDRRLSPGFRQWLQTLESLEPRTPLGSVVNVLRRELKGQLLHQVRLGPAPLAEGSVAVVVPFTWEPEGARPREAVFKLLKPGIQKRLAEDLELLSSLAEFLDDECERFRLPPLQYQETFASIRELLVHEVHLEQEQRHLVAMRRFYSNDVSVCIPELLPLCSPRVTAMEKLGGRKLLLANRQHDRKSLALAQTVAEALVCRPFFASETQAIFHGDPHAGNLLETIEGRLGILDWSLTGTLTKTDRVALMQVLLAAMSLDTARMARALASLALDEPPLRALQPALEASLSELRNGGIPAAAWLTRLLDSLVVSTGLRMRPNLLLFRKALLTLEGVLADLAGPERRTELLDQAFVSSFVSHLAAEGPQRVFAFAGDRSFATHLSNSDMAAAWLGLPAILNRWWAGVFCQWLR